MSGEKTEQPTHKKLRDARKKGQVPHSKDTPKAVMFAAFVLALMAGGAFVVDGVLGLAVQMAEHSTRPFPEALPRALQQAVRFFAETVFPVVVASAACVVVVEFLTVGPVFASEKIKIDFNNLNPINALKNWFSMRNLIELVKSLLKVVFLCLLVWLQLRFNLHGLAWTAGAGMPAFSRAMSDIVFQMVTACALLFIVIAAADLFVTRWLFTRDQKMSKDEVKREYKEMEGDPYIKGHRKHLHREVLEGGVRQAVRKSTAVVTNPTHIAVALRYERGKTPLPVVMAMGVGVYARAIREEAADAGIPVVRNVYLARQLYADAQTRRYVPLHLLEEVALVLRALAHAQGRPLPQFGPTLDGEDGEDGEDGGSGKSSSE